MMSKGCLKNGKSLKDFYVKDIANVVINTFTGKEDSFSRVVELNAQFFNQIASQLLTFNSMQTFEENVLKRNLRSQVLLAATDLLHENAVGDTFE